MGVDRIHVLADAKVQEEGTHQELLDGKGYIPYPDDDTDATDVNKGGKYYQKMWENFLSK